MTTSSITKPLIVVLNWNGKEDTIRCIDSLLMQSEPAAILVIDNASSDHSVEAFQEHFGQKIFIKENKQNLGFAGGVNVGIQYAIDNKYEYIALFNNDATAQINWLGELRHAIQPSEIGIATGLLLHKGGETIDSTGELYSHWGLAFPRDRHKAATQASEQGFIFGATGGATLYKTAVFKEIGLFDERFFAYYEDVDVSFRAQLAGWKVIYTPSAIAYHEQGMTSKKIPGLTTQKLFSNLPQVFIKNIPRGLVWQTGVRLYAAYFFFLGRAILDGRGIPAIRGFFHNIALTPGSLSLRRHIQKQKKVSVDYIKSILYSDLPPEQTGMRALRKRFTGK